MASALSLITLVGHKYGKNASVVVFPTTKEDVAFAVQTLNKTKQGKEFAFVAGANCQTNASTATKFIIDLSWLNQTQVLKKVKGATAGSNYTAVGARVGSVGAGGSSNGGDVGFLAGAYGYASDRLAAMEVVLMNGKIVNATKTNQYKNPFWALQRGGGHFFPADLANGLFALNTLLVTLRFDGRNRATQKSANATFPRIDDGLTITATNNLNSSYRHMTQSINGFFPFLFRRDFYGPQAQIITLGYLANGTALLNRYVADIAAAGDIPASSIWTPQYMYPGLNGNLPKSDADTAWPHARAEHQTLFSPAWRNVVDDVIMKDANWELNGKKFDKQIYDYPNYISPGVKAKGVGGIT
ncbi:FAD-binding domain-containing protein 7 [Elsinoe australis]|uniref:FAD-binding domain-containing protein 7 n=1 Tax=Elsinoe australis TaxID=40998 RepID=A0A4U7B8M5_9PEZI|nr:FAD-binding domain-containing protein 7 [Elsinoe australis]